MRIFSKLSIFALLICVSGCSVNQAILADSVTTAYAIDGGHAAEANHILPKSAVGAAVVSAGLKIALLHYAKNHGKCGVVAKSIYASSMGAAANNLAVIGDAKRPGAIGVAAGVGAYKFKSDSVASKYCD